MNWVCAVIMWSLTTRIEKSHSYSISYSSSNLKLAITRLPCNLPALDPQDKHDGCSPCSCCCLFCSLGRFRRCRNKLIWGWTTQMPSLLFTRRVTRAVQISAQLIIYVAAIRTRENNSGPSLPMLFQPFQPSLMRVEKVEQPNQPKRFFANRTRNNSTNPTNLKRLIPIEHSLWNGRDMAYFIHLDWARDIWAGGGCVSNDNKVLTLPL